MAVPITGGASAHGGKESWYVPTVDPRRLGAGLRAGPARVTPSSRPLAGPATEITPGPLPGYWLPSPVTFTNPNIQSFSE